MSYIDKIQIDGVDYDLVEDTGWVDCEINPNMCVLTYEDKPIQVRRIGKILFFRGQINIIAGGTEQPLVYVPEGFRPSGAYAPVANTGQPQISSPMYYKSSLNAWVFYFINQQVTNVRVECTCTID